MQLWNWLGKYYFSSDIRNFISHITKDLWHFDRVSAYFSDTSQNFQMHKISLVSFWIERLMYKEWIKVIIRQADSYDKKGDSTKGGRVCKIWLLYQKHLEINYFHVYGYYIINTRLQITVKVF